MAGVDSVFRTFHVGCISSAQLLRALKRGETEQLCIVPLFDVSAGFSVEVLAPYLHHRMTMSHHVAAGRWLAAAAFDAHEVKHTYALCLDTDIFRQPHMLNGPLAQELQLLTERLQPYARPYTAGKSLPYVIDNRYQRTLSHVFTCAPFVVTLLGSGFVCGVAGFGAAQRLRKDFPVLRHARVERVKDQNPPWVWQGLVM